jgi:transcriptional regulator with XRE-family HTH domain
LRKKKSVSQAKLADLIGAKRTSVSGWEGGNNYPTVDLILKLAKFFDISLDDLMTKNLSVESQDEYHRKSISVEYNSDECTPNDVPLIDNYVPLTRDLLQKNVLIPIKAQASYMVGWPAEYFENELITIDVPGISGEARTFEVAGNSMWPIIMDGDYLACTKVERHQEIKEGVVYVIISRESGILAKYVRLEKEGLQMISANNLEYRPFIVSFDEVREIWEAKVKISKHFDPIIPSDNNTQLLARLEKVESYLSQIFPEVKQE